MELIKKAWPGPPSYDVNIDGNTVAKLLFESTATEAEVDAVRDLLLSTNSDEEELVTARGICERFGLIDAADLITASINDEYGT